MYSFKRRVASGIGRPARPEGLSGRARRDPPGAQLRDQKRHGRHRQRQQVIERPVSEQRAQQQQAAQMQQELGTAIQGAQVLSQTDTGGDNALTALAGAM